MSDMMTEFFNLDGRSKTEDSKLNEENENEIFDLYGASETFEQISIALETTMELSRKLSRWADACPHDKPVNLETLAGMRSQLSFIQCYAEVMAKGMMIEYQKTQNEG